eukprot:gene13379-9206_t
MIHNQCRAYCQCDFCKNPDNKGRQCGDTACLKIAKENCDGTGPSKDELYAKCLKETLNNRALIASMKNAKRFVPDEMLVSSKKRREAKEAELASQLVPVRRRDRLEEMLLLENQARLREEMRLRAERRALGLPEEEQTGKQTPEEVPGSAVSVSEKSESTTSSQQQRRLGSGDSTASSRCSADRELRNTLRTLQGIMDEDPETNANQPLTRNQVLQLRKLVHEQSKKTREKVGNCPNQPHLCPHCFAVNVQGKHLCPQMSGSVAYRSTGKIINPNAGVSYGTREPPMGNGQYSDNMDSNMLGKRARVKNFNTHPHGTGVVFLPVTMDSNQGNQGSAVKPRHEFYNGPRNQPVFNNNIADNEPAEGDLQYPGSTYNVYDARNGAYGAERGNVPPPPQVEGAAAEAGRPAPGAGTYNAAERGEQQQQQRGCCCDPMDQYKTTSSLWRTTNQERETDMQRFLDFQKGRMNATGKQVYDESASRFGPGATPQN